MWTWSVRLWWVGLEGGNLRKPWVLIFGASLFFFFFLFLTGPVCFPQSVCFGYYQIPEGLKGGSYLPEHNCNDNLWEPFTHNHVWKDERLHCLIPKENLSGVNQTITPTAKENAPMLTCFYMSHILILCSVLLELIWECEAACVKHEKWEAGAIRGCGWLASKSTTFLITNGMSSLFFFFLLRITEYQEKWAMIFFFSFYKTFFFKKTILYDSHAKARIVLGWIYFKYQRSIFTYCILESSWWKIHNCGWLSRREGYVVPLPPVFSIWTCAFSELCFHRQNSVDISIFVLNLIIGLCGIFKQ